MSEALLDYIQRLVQYSREAPEFADGLSPRGALALIASAKSWALIEDRQHVVPEDVQAVLPSVVTLRLRETDDFSSNKAGSMIQRMLFKVDVIH